MPSKKLKLPALNSRAALTALTYLSLLLALIFTTLLYTSCIPLKPSSPSATRQFHAISLSTRTTKISIGNFALCASSSDGATHCTASRMKKTGEVLKALGGKVSEADVVAAVKLQKKVFFGIPVVSNLLTFAALVCVICAQILGTSKLLPKIKLGAIAAAGMAVAIMLVDAFSSELALSALEIATGVQIRTRAQAQAQAQTAGGAGVSGQFDGYVFKRGMYYMVFQWMSFGFGVISVGILAVRGVVSKAVK